MSTQAIMNDMRKQINAILLSYASDFTQQDKTMTDIMFLFDNLNYKMENPSSKSQDLDPFPDVIEFDPEVMELCSTNSP